MNCIKCGIDSPAPLCFKCFDKEILKIPGVTTDYKLVKQEDGSYKTVAVYKGITLKGNKNLAHGSLGK